MTTMPTEVTSAEARPSWVRIAGYAGIAYTVLFLVLGVSIAAGAPVFTDGADELRARFGDNQGPVALFTWLGPLASGPLYLLFAAGLRTLLERVDPSDGMLTRISYSGAVASFTFSIVGLAFWGVMTLDPGSREHRTVSWSPCQRSIRLCSSPSPHGLRRSSSSQHRW